jgi:hypothetical protein
VRGDHNKDRSREKINDSIRESTIGLKVRKEERERDYNKSGIERRALSVQRFRLPTRLRSRPELARHTGQDILLKRATVVTCRPFRYNRVMVSSHAQLPNTSLTVREGPAN